jgi:hypothetical protein
MAVMATRNDRIGAVDPQKAGREKGGTFSRPYITRAGGLGGTGSGHGAGSIHLYPRRPALIWTQCGDVVAAEGRGEWVRE